MMRRTMLWSIRLPLFPLLLVRNASHEDASEQEIFSGAFWFTLGMATILPAIVVSTLYCLNYLNLFSGKHVLVFITGSLLAYLLVGVGSFFSEKKTNADCSWYSNGRW